jgi:hypothetical protein
MEISICLRALQQTQASRVTFLCHTAYHSLAATMPKVGQKSKYARPLFSSCKTVNKLLAKSSRIECRWPKSGYELTVAIAPGKGLSISANF